MCRLCQQNKIFDNINNCSTSTNSSSTINKDINAGDSLAEFLICSSCRKMAPGVQNPDPNLGLKDQSEVGNSAVSSTHMGALSLGEGEPGKPGKPAGSKMEGQMTTLGSDQFSAAEALAEQVC